MTDDPDRPSRAPWETEPFVDPQAATSKAIASAQPRRSDPNATAVKAWAAKAFDTEIANVRNASKGHRQKTLFPAAANLFEIVAAGALPELDVYNALRDACRSNRLESDDGEKSIENTLKNARRKGFDNPRDLSLVGTRTTSQFVVLGEEKIEVVTLDDIETIERGFWTQRDSLQQIYLAALSGMCAPWAVLGCCAARALTLVRPNCVLPPIIGGHRGGSLNWFCALTAKSGGGKDMSIDIAEDLINQEIMTRNLGSGEGLIDQYVKPKDPDSSEAQGLYEAIMFTETEIDTMAVLSNRAGATLSPTLRKAFTGSTIGFSYRTASKQHLLKHSYRLTLVVGIQPGKAGALMDDSYGGTLQRFMWFPASDNRVTNEPPPFPGKLALPSPSSWQYDQTLQIPYEAIELIRDERVRQNRGDGNPEDGHAMFIREKFAYALAVLDGRDHMNSEDWALAGTAMRVSDHTRKWVRFELLRIQEEQVTEQGRLQGVKISAADEERAYKTNERLGRIAKWAQAKIYNAGTEGVAHRDLMRAVASRDRPHLPAALDKLAGTGVIEQVKGAGKQWVWHGDS